MGIKIRWTLLTIMMYVFRVFPIKTNKILFCSYRGDSYSCNPKYIAEKLYEINSSLDYVWIINDSSSLPTGMRSVSNKSIKKLYELATAKIWVSNTRMPVWVRKRKRQYYIQTWHAGISNKPGERFTEDKLTKEYVKSAKQDSKMADLFLSNSKWLTNSYREGFWYTGKILEKGLPREDILLDKKELFHNKVCDYYKVSRETHFILYAPTFRKDGNLSCYDMDYNRLLDTLKRKSAYEWKVLIRLHPNIRNESININFGEKCINASKYDEINELIMASDFLISDYSSCLFDGMIAKCKVLVYASDIDTYSEDRGFFFRWDELPFLIATNNDELEKSIMLFDDDKYFELVSGFKEKCGYVHNGNASKEVAEHILCLLSSNKNTSFAR